MRILLGMAMVQPKTHACSALADPSDSLASIQDSPC